MSETHDVSFSLDLGGDPGKMVKYTFKTPNPRHLTFDVAFDGKGHAYVSNSGYGGDADRGIEPVPSSVYKLRLENGEIRYVASSTSTYEGDGYEAFRQVAEALRPGRRQMGQSRRRRHGDLPGGGGAMLGASAGSLAALLMFLK